MQFLTATLKNGLEIVAECNPDAYSTALGFFVKTGARDETDDIAGVSHFLEHMVFKGTPTRSADDVNRQFDEMGAHYNAFTNEEMTVFYAAVLPECLARALGLLADILRPTLREEDFDTEKKVILEEIQMYEDQPPFGADEKCRAAYFGPHALGRSVLGTLHSVAALPVAAMRAYFSRRYQPGNIVLAVAGRVDFYALLESVSNLCGDWEPGADPRTIEPSVPQPGFRTLYKPSATQQYAVAMSPAPAARDPGRYAASLLSTVLGDDSGSRLYWELVDSGLAEHAEMSHCEYEGAGAFITYMSCMPEEAAGNLQRIFEVYRQVQAEGVTRADLEQAKSKWRSRIVLSGERPRGRLRAIGADWLYRREYRSVEDELNAVAAVTVDDVAAILAKYPLNDAATITIGPLKEVEEPK
jgi:predicted Zn-dependent peptidase